MPLSKSMVIQAGRTTNGNITFTGSLGGLTPTACKFYLINVTSENTTETDMLGSYGFTDGVNQSSSAFHSDNGGTASTGRRSSTSHVLQRLGPSSNLVTVSASFVSFQANSVTINYDVTNGNAYLIKCILYAGVSAEVGTFNSNISQDSGVTISGLGFFPRFIEFSGFALQANDQSSNTKINYGCAVLFNSSIKQGNQVLQNRNGADPTTVTSTTQNNRVLSNTDSPGELTYTLEVTNIQSDQFTVTTRDASGNVDHAWQYLALGTDEDEVNIIEMDLPGGGGTPTVAYTGLGFEPDFMMFFGSLCDAYNDTKDGSQAEGIAISHVDNDGADTFNLGWSTEDDVVIAKTINRLQNNRAIQTRDASGTVKHDGNFQSFDPDGVTIQFNTAPQLIKYFGVGYKKFVTSGQLVDRNPLLGNKLVGGTLVG